MASRFFESEFSEGDKILVDHQGKSSVFVARPAPAEPVEAVEEEVI